MFRPCAGVDVKAMGNSLLISPKYGDWYFNDDKDIWEPLRTENNTTVMDLWVWQGFQRQP